MTDRSEPDLSNHFGRLRSADVPDVWSRIVAENDSDGVAPAPVSSASVEVNGVGNSGVQAKRVGARRWLGAAAAVLLVVGAVAGLVWSSGVDDLADVDSVDAPPSGPPASDSVAADDPVDSSGAPVTAPAPVFGTAIIQPEVVAVGDQFSITPSAPIQPICLDPLIVRDATTLTEVGVIGGRADGTYGLWGEVDFAMCGPEDTAASVTHTVPDGLALGTHVVCRTFELDESGCGTLTVGEVSAPTPEPELGAFGDASIDPAVTPAGFVVTLTPTSEVELDCGEPGSLYSATDNPELLGLVSIGETGVWRPNTPDGIAVSACAEAPSSAAASYRVPDELAPGDYILCRGFELVVAGCATFTIVALADSSDPNAVPLTTLPPDVPVLTNPPDRPRIGPLADALTAAGVDVPAAPIDAVLHEGSTFCGDEETGLLGSTSPDIDIDVRRCFLDHHMAALDATFVSVGNTDEGDPIVTVWRTRYDGSVETWTDSTRYPFGSGTWEQVDCGRLTAPDRPEAPATAFECADLIEPLVDIEPTPFPDQFLNRPQAPQCGYITITPEGDDPAAGRIIDCFNTAVANNEPTEAVVRIVDGLVRTTRWLTHTGDRSVEIHTLTIDLTDRRVAGWITTTCANLTPLTTTLIVEPIDCA